MCETDRVVFCPKCQRHTPHIFSGSGRKRSCYDCGLDTDEDNVYDTYDEYDLFDVIEEEEVILYDRV